MSQGAWSGIAQAILDGFDRHYALFREFSQAGRACFERGDWKGAHEASLERIQGYEQRVTETVNEIRRHYPEAASKSSSWPHVKRYLIGKLMNHLQAECAETFYNSVACRVLHRDYYKGEYIFWRPAISTEYLEGSQPTYRSHQHHETALAHVLPHSFTAKLTLHAMATTETTSPIPNPVCFAVTFHPIYFSSVAAAGWMSKESISARRASNRSK